MARRARLVTRPPCHLTHPHVGPCVVAVDPARDPDDEPATPEQLAGLLADALDLVSGCLDDVLPDLRHQHADDAEWARLDLEHVESQVAQAWAGLTVAAGTLARSGLLRPDVRAVLDAGAPLPDTPREAGR